MNQAIWLRPELHSELCFVFCLEQGLLNSLFFLKLPSCPRNVSVTLSIRVYELGLQATYLLLPSPKEVHITRDHRVIQHVSKAGDPSVSLEPPW